MPKKGYKQSREHYKKTIKNLLKSQKNPYIRTKAIRKKNSDSLKGHIGYFTGKQHSEKTKRKISKLRKARLKELGYLNSTKTRLKMSNSLRKRSLLKSSHYVTGYPKKYNKTLKDKIRKRDNYTCQNQVCNKKQGKRLLDIHHIDYNKENCNPNNLITLCMSCHAKTNTKRKYWINYFKKLMRHWINYFKKLMRHWKFIIK